MPSQKEASVFLKYNNVYAYAIYYPSFSRLPLTVLKGAPEAFMLVKCNLKCENGTIFRDKLHENTTIFSR